MSRLPVFPWGPALAAAPRAALAAILGLALAACGDATGPDPRVIEGVDVDALFAPATPAEREAVAAEWAAREPHAEEVREELSLTSNLAGEPATLRVLSHVVDGHRHYGLVWGADGAPAASLPVLVYAHGGDGGVDAEELLAVAGLLGADAAAFVYVAPSFRSEPLSVGRTTFRSEGPASPWDRDVDDALALLEAVLETIPAADPERVGVLGLSRGGGVALLMGIRDPRVRRVVEFFGPTDFFDDYVRDIFEEALRGEVRDLPGLRVLNERFIQPLRRGELSTAEVRREMVRRSAVLFADRLPATQLHHGTADQQVDVSQALSLIEAMEALGRGPADFQAFLYEGAGHNPLQMPESLPRTRAFLMEMTRP